MTDTRSRRTVDGMPPRLPPAIAAYRDRAVARAVHAPRQVRIEQEGEMWLRPGAVVRRFTAFQHIAVDRVAFAWRARFPILPILPLLAFRVVDAYDDGAGALEVRLLGRNLRRQTGPETTAGEAMRYLAELPWAPHAIEANRALRWHGRDDGRIDVVAGEGDAAVRVTFDLDDEGDIVRASTPARPYWDGRGWRPMPWVGRFGDYRLLGGMRMPTWAEVRWDLPEAPFVYWRGRLLAAAALAEPLARGTGGR